MFSPVNPVLSIGQSVSQSVRKSPQDGASDLMGEPQSAPVIFGFPQLVLLRSRPNVAFPLLIRQLPSCLTHSRSVGRILLAAAADLTLLLPLNF